MALYLCLCLKMTCEGFRVKWEALSKLDPYCRKLSESAVTFRDKVDELNVKYAAIRESLDALKTCPLQVRCVRCLFCAPLFRFVQLRSGVVSCGMVGNLHVFRVSVVSELCAIRCGVLLCCHAVSHLC